jgi:hypothetical protein
MRYMCMEIVLAFAVAAGLYAHIRWDSHHANVLTVNRGKVNGITYLGPHSVYYDGLC